MQKPLNTSLGCNLGPAGQLGFSSFFQLGFQAASFFVVGKELCKSGSVDHKVKEKQIGYFNEQRQMQMTPRQKKHLDYLAKKNGANGSDY